MRGLWNFLKDRRNQITLGWLGGGFAVVAVGAWAVFVYSFPPDKGGNTQPAVTIESPGGAAAGRDIHARDITIGANPIHREASLSLVDVVVSDAADEFPTIEVKVRNNSDEVIFLKRAELTTLGQWDVPKFVEPKFVPVSWKYDVLIPRQGTVNLNISQQVGPNSVDRFAFRAGPDQGSYPYEGLFAYLLRLKLVYNEDNKELITPTVLLDIPAPFEVLAHTSRRPHLFELEENKKAAQDILARIGDNTIAQNGIIDAIKSWADADFSHLQRE